MRGVMALRVASPALARDFCGPSYGRRLARGARKVPRLLIVLTTPVVALRPSRAPLTVRVGPPLLHERGIGFPLRNWRADFVRDFREAYARLGGSSATNG